MAVPFIPSLEEADDLNQRLHQLLLDVYRLLQILLTRQQQEQSQSLDNDTPANLPDLVSDIATAQSLPLVRKRTTVVPSRRRRRRHDKSQSDQQNNQQLTQQQAQPQLLSLGIELRQIAEEISSTTRASDGTKKKRREVKVSNLFSVLVPASSSLTGSIWTTVIIIVGWRLLSRQR